MNTRSNQACLTINKLKQAIQNQQSTQLAITLKNATTTTVLLICGIALPWLAHRFGFGMAFLPMHLPLLIGGFLLPFGYAFFLAVMIPLTNTALIGMPVFFPALPTLVIELTVYILAIKYFLQIRHNNIFMSLIFALFLGRIATTIVALVFGHIIYTGFSSIALYFNHLIADFLPGLAIQLLIISLLIPKLLPIFNQNKNK